MAGSSTWGELHWVFGPEPGSDQRPGPLPGIWSHLLGRDELVGRYQAMELLEELAETARRGAGPVWLLCPMEDPGHLPRLDTTVVPVPEYEWIALPDAWATNEHRTSPEG